MKLPLFLALTLSLLAPKAYAIWSGIPVPPDQSVPPVFYLSMDALYGGERGEYECTGTLVHPRLILTAGHCSQDQARVLYAVNGIWKKALNRWVVENGKTLPEHGFVLKFDDIERVVPNVLWGRPGLGYAGKISQDFGYIVLKNPITGITPATVRYFTSAADVRTNLLNQQLDIVGYGYPDPELDPTVPLYGLKLMSHKAAAIANLDYIQTLRGYGAPLEGDSGGAAFLSGTHTLVGIITGATYGSTKEENYVSNYATLSKTTVCWIQKSSGVIFSDAVCQ